MDTASAKAIEILEQFFQDSVQRQIYLESERSRMDRLSNEKYYRQQGREEGAERVIVKALRKQSVTDTDVARFLDLPVDYVQTIAVKNGVMTM